MARQKYRGLIQLSTHPGQTLVTAGQDYDLTGVYADGYEFGFSLAANGVLTYLGNTILFPINGFSGFKTDKACEIFYSLWRKPFGGSYALVAETPQDVSATNKLGDINIAGLVKLSYLDDLKVMARSDIANTLLTLATLGLLFTEQ